MCDQWTTLAQSIDASMPEEIHANKTIPYLAQYKTEASICVIYRHFINDMELCSSVGTNQWKVPPFSKSGYQPFPMALTSAWSEVCAKNPPHKGTRRAKA